MELTKTAKAYKLYYPKHVYFKFSLFMFYDVFLLTWYATLPDQTESSRISLANNLYSNLVFIYVSILSVSLSRCFFSVYPFVK